MVKVKTPTRDANTWGAHGPLVLTSDLRLWRVRSARGVIPVTSF